MSNRMVSLDGARGIAAFCILLFHLSIEHFSMLYLAVDFFFVLSGFVLANNIDRIKSITQFKTFIILRYFRIVPMLLSVMLFYLIYDLALILYSYVHARPLPDLIVAEPLTIIFSLTLLQVFYQPALLVVYPVWSLSAEWITNLFFPIMTRHRRNRSILGTILGSIVICVSSYLDFETLNQIGRALLGFTLGYAVSRIHGFYLSKNISLLTIFTLTIPYLMIAPKLGNYQSLLSGPFFAFVIVQLSRIETGAKTQMYCSFLGKYSYGFYLWHFPLMMTTGDFLSRVYWFQNLNANVGLIFHGFLTAILTLLVTLLVLRIIESPIRTWAQGRFQPITQ